MNSSRSTEPVEFVKKNLKCYNFRYISGTGDIRDLNRNSDNWAVVKAALAAGAYPNLARYDREGRQLRSQ